MTAHPGEPRSAPQPTDPELVGAVRSGDSDAYATLYTRHVDAARRLALALTRHPADADDLVAESFARLLGVLRGGGGPSAAFRAYLFTTVRNLWYDRTRRDRRLDLTDDLTGHDPGVPFVDTAVARFERTLVAQAFAQLPERWQAVLWHTEVEGERPATVATVLDLTPNGVSTLAYRARERLRQNYLRAGRSAGTPRPSPLPSGRSLGEPVAGGGVHVAGDPPDLPVPGAGGAGRFEHQHRPSR